MTVEQTWPRNTRQVWPELPEKVDEIFTHMDLNGRKESAVYFFTVSKCIIIIIM